MACIVAVANVSTATQPHAPRGMIDRTARNTSVTAMFAADYPVFGVGRIGGTATTHTHQQQINTFDLHIKKPLLFSDITKPEVDYRTVLAKLLHDYFKHEAQAGLTPSELVGLLDLPLEALEGFSLDNDKLLLRLNPRSPSTRDDRDLIAVDKNLVIDILKESYIQPNADLTPVSDDNIAYAITRRPVAGNVIDPNAKMLALTFDDGPGIFTPQLLDALNKYEAHATFFVLGSEAQQYPDVLRRIVREGHEAGNHSFNHAFLPRLYRPQLEWQINQTQTTIKDITNGYVPRLMRPPQGATNIPVSEFLHAQGLVPFLWDVDTKDWRDRETQTIYDRIMAGAGDGKVILLHDIHSASVEAAIRAIPALKAQGYQLVTSSELLQYR